MLMQDEGAGEECGCECEFELGTIIGTTAPFSQPSPLISTIVCSAIVMIYFRQETTYE